MKQSYKKEISFKSIGSDLPAGLVVFFVALPLCLGIALASGASPFAGIITGIIGGAVVGFLSNSHVSVTGPAAGLIAIVLVAIKELGFESFLAAVVLAGCMQFLLGLVKAGTVANYFPSSVIEGMLAAIGIIIIKKEIPHAVGYDVEHEGDFFNLELGIEHDAINKVLDAINFSHLGIILISLVSIGILILFAKVKALKRIQLLPAALVVVVAGVLLNWVYHYFIPSYEVKDEHLVILPLVSSASDLLDQFSLPNVSAFANYKVWITAITIAIVASIETLLCIEAGDKLDVFKRYSNPNRELKAQGIGNIIAGLIGGLPMTSVIVRTTANISAGAKTKLSTIIHGVLLLLAALFIPRLLNQIPLACLAAILIMTGFRLASPKVFKHMWQNGLNQFIPFIVTVVAVVTTDLLKGVGLGLAVSVFYILKGNMKLAYYFNKDEQNNAKLVTMELAQEVSFLNKAAIKETLFNIPEGAKLIIDARQTVYIDFDVLELIKGFLQFTSKEKNIEVELKNFKEQYNIADTKHVYTA